MYTSRGVIPSRVESVSRRAKSDFLTVELEPRFFIYPLTQ